MVAYEDLFDILSDYHANKTGHSGRIKTIHALGRKYYILWPPIEIFNSCCRSCNEKEPENRKVVVRPIILKDFGERGQVDLIDFQSLADGEYKWIFLAKQATTHAPPPPFKILPLSGIHRLILQSSIDDWVLSYPSSFSNSQSWYLTIQPQLTLKPWYFHFSDLSRSIIIKLSRLRFGHNRLPPHLHRIGLSPSSHCPLHPSHI